ncbi:MAG: cation diffusion facilitator family transporter [Flavobacteriaceae bacterium]
MAAHGGKVVIYAALAGNTLIAITKFAAAFYTGSSAMLSEGIHSLVDTGNQGLLLYGMKRASRPPDERYPFGHGPELYFWSFVVAIMIFAVGAGVSIYEGIEKLRHPHPVANPFVNYVVLGLAMIFEGAAWYVAWKAFNTKRGKLGFFEAVRDSKDPTVFTVLFEDTAAMLGLVVAAIGIGLAQWLDQPWLDGAASVAIGLILALTAWLLGVETKGLLIGEAAAPEVVRGIRRIVGKSDAVDRLNEIRTMHQGPSDVLLAISIDFKNNLKVGRVEQAVYEMEMAIKEKFPEIRRVFIEAQAARHHERILEQEIAEHGPPGNAET